MVAGYVEGVVTDKGNVFYTAPSVARNSGRECRVVAK